MSSAFEVVAIGRPAPRCAKARPPSGPGLRQLAREQEGHFQRLLIVQTGVAGRVVARREAGLRPAGHATDALGDVLAGQLEVNAPEPRARCDVQINGLLKLAQDRVERTGLGPLRSRRPNGS